MMTPRHILLIFIFLVVSGPLSRAQDKIVTRKKEVLKVRVTEQDNKYIRYRLEDYPDGPVFSMRLDRILTIN